MLQPEEHLQLVGILDGIDGQERVAVELAGLLLVEIAVDGLLQLDDLVLRRVV